LLDEAFNNLDPDLCEHVVGLLNAYRRAHDAAVVLTTHEPGWAADIADCAVRMEARPYRIEEVASRTRGIEPAGDAC
jgi:ABC-type multidrug transport system ATPase subunit